ncbi:MULTISPECIES: ABC transporter permease [unclassified Halanaerobium]|uniref:ABC transporter permease n=1 Tax=unclassified Halanaerobium TaxID=2641197 RepID=UPI000DF1E5D0|nr:MULTISPECIES: ABC transporter permease [unclassified Halanaerobium]RCW40109.1 peptide/nickel transport system permease protein/oligopeptide transport system permease protein [Halanaerobium sp. MA284_MarDTE_T2]RCW79405.1 peptide/nickel transport system permease protein/oligopeptide transport system permease protein [Halanaerobium sp. DL-01]
MRTYVARRFIQGLVVLLIVSFIAFFIFQYLGDPVMALAGRYASQAQRQQVREMLGLNQPFYIQYLSFINNASHGKFGMSYVTRVPVLNLILERLPASLELAFVAELITVILGISFGVFVAARPRSIFSNILMTGSLFGVSLPTFLVGIILIFIFSINFNILPPFGRGEVVQIWGKWRSGLLTLSGLKHIIMPAFTLGMFQMALLFRLTRGSMLEILGNDYIRTARSKGVSERMVLFKHALRNALIPVITMIGLQFGQLIGFSIVTESIFQWPGAGNLLLTSMYESDFPVIATYIIMVAVIIVTLNVFVDISYALLNPKIRYN